MLILTDNVSKLEIDLAAWDGEAYITVKVNSRGFSGQNDMHISSSVFQRFCSGFINLQKNLKGKAELKSISPNELDIIVEPDGSLGHIAVRGKCGYHVQTSRHSNWHSIEFGFEFEPQQLDRALKVLSLIHI